MSLRIAQIRIVPEKGNPACDLLKLRSALKAVRRHHPDVVATPECFLDGCVSTGFLLI
jgi:predicted amidohydrolase